MKRLYRSRSESMLGGVCGGLADYFVVDISLIRLAWIIFGLFGGGGVIAYLLAWLIIPAEPASPNPAPHEDRGGPDADADGSDKLAASPAAGPSSAGRGLGWVCVVLGSAFLLWDALPGPWSAYLWPALLMLVGGVLIARAQ